MADSDIKSVCISKYWYQWDTQPQKSGEKKGIWNGELISHVHKKKKQDVWHECRRTGTSTCAHIRFVLSVSAHAPVLELMYLEVEVLSLKLHVRGINRSHVANIMSARATCCKQGNKEWVQRSLTSKGKCLKLKGWMSHLQLKTNNLRSLSLDSSSFLSYCMCVCLFFLKISPTLAFLYSSSSFSSNFSSRLVCISIILFSLFKCYYYQSILHD